MSILQQNPKSRILIPGYINVYSELTAAEERQLHYKVDYKKQHPSWDETQVFLAKWFEKNAPENSVILDAGCGHGNYLIDENRKKIKWATGIDVSNEFVEKNICLDEIKIGNLEELPFDNESFDVVISLWVLEHLQNPTRVFEEIYRVLKPGGVFMFATPNRYFMPLVFIQVLRSRLINNLLNSRLFGRKKEDIFPTYYKANTINSIKALAGNKYNLDYLELNFDPSYTSFNGLTFTLTKWLSKLLPRSVFYAHITGILRKPFN